MAALGLLVAITSVVHAVNKLHVVVAETPLSQGYEVSGGIVVSVSGGTMNVEDGNSALLRGGDSGKVAFHDNFQGFVLVRMENNEYQFIVGYLMDGKRPYYGPADIHVNGELKAFNVNVLTHLCTYLFGSLSYTSSWLGVAFNTVDTTITIDGQNHEINGYPTLCDARPSSGLVARVCDARSCADACPAVDLVGVDKSNAITGANTDLDAIGGAASAESNTDTEVVGISKCEGSVVTTVAALAAPATTVGIG